MPPTERRRTLVQVAEDLGLAEEVILDYLKNGKVKLSSFEDEPLEVQDILGKVFRQETLVTNALEEINAIRKRRGEGAS